MPKGANVNISRRDGSTALMRAIENGHARIARILIQMPNIILEPLGNRQSPLNCAVRVGDTSLICFLLRYGADVNRCDAHGHSALVVACYTGNISITRLLLVRGAEPNRPVESHDGQTPLHIAVQRGHWFLAQLLLMFGADASVVNNDEVAVIHYAAWNGDEDLVRALVACGANVFAADAFGSLPLMYVEGHNNHEVVEVLREAMARGGMAA